MSQETDSGARATEPRSRQPQVVLRVPPLLTVAQEAAELVVGVLNLSDIVEHVRLTVTVVAPYPVTVTPGEAAVALWPAAEGSATFTVAPAPGAVAGPPAPATLLVTAEGVAGASRATEAVQLLVLPPSAAPAGRAPEPAPEARGRSSWWRRLRRRTSSPDPGPAAEPAPFHLLSDHPCPADEDILDFREVSARLATLVLDTRASTPFTVGVQGSWGAGKSSLMRLLQAEVERQGAQSGHVVRTVWFNVWTAEGSSAMTALIRSVLEQMDPRVVRRLVRRTRASSWVSLPFVVLATWLGLRRLADDLWERFRVDATQRNEVRGHLQASVQRWVEGDVGLADRMLVVFIDDLDRASPQNVLEVLEALQLYLNAPGFVFVIGYDEEVVEEALQRARSSTDPVRSRRFLEKIVQVDYPVPMPTDEQARELAAACARRSGVSALLGDAELELVLDRTGRNPRRLKRFVNAFVLSWQLDAAAADLRPEEYIKVLLLRVYFPALYGFLLTQDDDVLGRLVDLSLHRRAVAAGSEIEPEQAARLFEVFGVAPQRPGETPEAALDRLDAHAPALLVDSSRDEVLLSVAWRLGTAEERQDLVRRLRRRPPTAPGAVPEEPDVRGGPVECTSCGHVDPVPGDFCSRCGAYLTWSR